MGDIVAVGTVPGTWWRGRDVGGPKWLAAVVRRGGEGGPWGGLGATWCPKGEGLGELGGGGLLVLCPVQCY